MAMGLECKWIVFDHLHMLLSMTTDGDERRNIDSIMHNFRTPVKRQAWASYLCHTSEGLMAIAVTRMVLKLTESPTRLAEYRSVVRLCDIFERNQQSEDPIEASTTRVRVLKSRYTGDVGLATHLFYDKDSGRLSEISMEVEEQEEIEL